MIDTLIEWATHSLNFWWGCTKVSPACQHCYAETLAKLFSKGKATWGPNGARWLRGERAALELAKIVSIAAATGVRPRVFVNSMSDTFEANPLLDATRFEMLALFASTPSVDFLLLTKRPENIRDMVPPVWLWAWPENVWVGTTVESQEWADTRIPYLLNVPARVRFLSMEPLLGPVTLRRVKTTAPGAGGTCFLDVLKGEGRSVGGVWPSSALQWIIVGGESGGGARPMYPDAVRLIRNQCQEAGVPFFFKQWGEWKPCDYDGTSIRITTPIGVKCPKNPGLDDSYGLEMTMARVGKKAAGRELDGREWNEIPKPAA